MNDYHIAEAKRDHDGQGGQGWQARCRCGWFGPKRQSKDAAEADALAHDEAEK